MINEFEFFHGVVLCRLLHGSNEPIDIRPYPTASNSSYILNERIGLFVKYCAKRMSPWGFTFRKNHQEEIYRMSREMPVFVLLVCNDDGIVCLAYDELRLLLDGNFEESESIRIRRKPREKYSLAGTDGKLKFKIGASDFPKKVLNLP